MESRIINILNKEFKKEIFKLEFTEGKEDDDFTYFNLTCNYTPKDIQLVNIKYSFRYIKDYEKYKELVLEKFDKDLLIKLIFDLEFMDWRTNTLHEFSEIKSELTTIYNYIWK